VHTGPLGFFSTAHVVRKCIKMHENVGSLEHRVTPYGEEFEARGVIHVILANGHVILAIFDANGNLLAIIEIVGTGDCFYRAVAASENPDLLAADRTVGNESGKLIDEGLDEREIAVALQLRQEAAALGGQLFIDGAISLNQIVESNTMRPGRSLPLSRHPTHFPAHWQAGPRCNRNQLLPP
jgi:hypothetical protein